MEQARKDKDQGLVEVLDGALSEPAGGMWLKSAIPAKARSRTTVVVPEWVAAGEGVGKIPDAVTGPASATGSPSTKHKPGRLIFLQGPLDFLPRPLFFFPA